MALLPNESVPSNSEKGKESFALLNFKGNTGEELVRNHPARKGNPTHEPAFSTQEVSRSPEGGGGAAWGIPGASARRWDSPSPRAGGGSTSRSSPCSSSAPGGVPSGPGEESVTGDVSVDVEPPPETPRTAAPPGSGPED